MFRDITQVPVYNSHAPTDGPPDAFGGSGMGTLLHRTRGVLKAQYSFAINGGAIGTIPLLDDLGNKALLPTGAIIVRSYIDFIVQPTSGGAATLALQAQNAGDILAAAVVTGMTVGQAEGVSTNTAATFKKLTAQGQISAVVAVAALTAGQFNVYVEFVY